jgi:hypothetical protein
MKKMAVGDILLGTYGDGLAHQESWATYEGASPFSLSDILLSDYRGGTHEDINESPGAEKSAIEGDAQKMIMNLKRRVALVLLALLMTTGMALSLAPSKAEAHGGTCTHGSTWHYGSSTYYYHAVYYAGYYRTNSGQHVHRYNVYYYYYGSSGWYLYDYQRVVRVC